MQKCKMLKLNKEKKKKKWSVNMEKHNEAMDFVGLQKQANHVHL